MTIKNFNIVNGYDPGAGQFPEWQFGIRIYDSTQIKIIGNNATKNLFFIWLENSRHNEIIGNNIYKNNIAIRLNYSSYNIISHNNISFNEWGVILDWHNTNNNITENTITFNMQTGIHLLYSSNNVIMENNITSNEYGVSLTHLSRNNRILGNIISNNWCGITFENASSTNSIYHNNFIENEQQILDFHWSSPWVPASTNTWNNSYPSGGNYWSNYTGVDYYSGPKQDQPGSDGIGDMPHVIDENNVDYYPLMGPFRSLKVFAEYALGTVSNSTIEGFQYNESSKTLTLYVSNKTSEQTRGFCRITIPHALIPPPYNVTVNNVSVQFTTIFENETLSIIYFTYEHSIVQIKITTYPAPPPSYNLTILASTGGTTSPTPGIYTYPQGAEVSVTAIPNEGFSFSHWLLNGNVRTENPIIVVMNADYILEAYFIDNIPPQISNPKQDPPENVQPGQGVRVWVNVTDFGTGVKNVTLWYSLNNGTTWTIINMTAYREIHEALWGATIPGYGYCTWVSYKIVAYDNAGNNATKDNLGYYYQYHVIPEYPSTLILALFLLTTLIATILRKTQ